MFLNSGKPSSKSPSTAFIIREWRRFIQISRLLRLKKHSIWQSRTSLPVNIYLFKVNNRNIRKRCEICSKLTIKTTERRHWHNVIDIVCFELNVSDIFLSNSAREALPVSSLEILPTSNCFLFFCLTLYLTLFLHSFTSFCMIQECLSIAFDIYYKNRLGTRKFSEKLSSNSSACRSFFRKKRCPWTSFWRK